MKNHLLFFLIAILSSNAYSQINYEPGYYITNSNQRIDCLILNRGLKDNPTQFEYKRSENSDKAVATIETVKAFGIINSFKYSRHIVKIDQSEKDTNKLSRSTTTVFEEQEVFLKVLVEGKASLYSYNDNYFYSNDDSEIEQLIFKEYVNNEDKIAEFNRYKQQLWSDLKCESINMGTIENVDFNKNELVRFFVKYNECTDQDFTNFEKKKKIDLIHLTIRPGFKTASLSVNNVGSIIPDVDFGNESGFRLGLEAEFTLPFYKNKWALIIEPTYQYFKSETEITAYFQPQNVSIDYKSIELPLGLRHYMFLNDNSKIFLNAAFVVDFRKKTLIDYEMSSDIEIKSSGNFAFGIGYKYNNKYSVELRHQTSRDLLNYAGWRSNYIGTSIIVGYTLF